MSPLTAIILAFSAGVSAHGIVTSYVVGTKTIQGYSPQFQYMPTPPVVAGWTAPLTQDFGPVPGNSLNDPDIICHRGATNAKGYVDIAAGESIKMLWTTWQVLHKGPMLGYLADCGGDCTTIDKTQLKFFKIDGLGMISTEGAASQAGFASDIMLNASSTWDVTIPASIKPGKYVLRHETIALQNALRAGESQPYPQCINLNIAGSGTDQPSGVPGTALYSTSDPGILFDLYKTFTNTAQYTVPGPSLYSGAAKNFKATAASYGDGDANATGAAQVTTTSATSTASMTMSTSPLPSSTPASTSSASTLTTTSTTITSRADLWGSPAEAAANAGPTVFVTTTVIQKAKGSKQCIGKRHVRDFALTT